MRIETKIKFLIVFGLCFIQLNLFAQRIGYEWIKSIDSSSQVISIFDNENKLIVAADENIKKFDISGNILWSIDDTLFNASGIAIDNENNIYITGTNTKYISQGQNSYLAISYIYIAKYNSLGNRIWKSTTNTQTSENSYGNFSTSIACDLNNAIYITGSYTDSISFDSFQLTDNNASAIFIAKYDTNGVAQWARKIFGTNTNDGLTYGQGNEIVIDQNGFIYLTGSYRGPFNFGGTLFSCNLIGDIFLSKLDSNGFFLDTKVIGSNEHDEGTRLIVDSNNNLILLAKFGDVISINDIQYQAIDNYNNAIILKIANDSIVMATQIGYSNGGAIISDICVDKNQNIIYVGSIGNWPTLFPMIYKINNTGQIDWSYAIAESTTENFATISSIVSDTTNSFFIAGSFNQTAYFGSELLETDNLFQTYLGKIDTNQIFPTINFSDNSSSIIIFPNPTQGNFTILSFEKNLENSVLYLYNTAGQIIKQFSLTTNQSQLQIDELSSGMYFAVLVGENFREKFKIVKY